ncbi:hypothetical protein C8J57DRAFT_1537296 [Mycena rebaudengoi]|nr:hypothetical protein C8J57DRAFT_1537296 [Mycena rebaudengoi]
MESADDMLLRRTKRNRHNLTVYDTIAAKIDTMGDSNLKSTTEAPFTANLICEIGSQDEGTWMAAYPKKHPPQYKLPYDDVTSKSHRMIIAARCPTGAPEKICNTFNDGMGTCDTLRSQDEKVEIKNKETWEVTEFLERSDGNMNEPCDILTLRLPLTYEVPAAARDAAAPPATPRRARVTKVNSSPAKPSSSLSTADDIDMDADSKEVEKAAERRVGDTYPPKKLPDHRGEYFNHSKARLVQRDFKDIDGTLIAPHELYEKLTEGTLRLVQVSLVTYIIADDKKKIYHALVERLSILDRGYGKPWKPAIPSLPERKTYPSSPNKRSRDSATDAAFDNFTTSSPSPAKRSRT